MESDGPTHKAMEKCVGALSGFLSFMAVMEQLFGANLQFPSGKTRFHAITENRRLRIIHGICEQPCCIPFESQFAFDGGDVRIPRKINHLGRVGGKLDRMLSRPCDTEGVGKHLENGAYIYTPLANVSACLELLWHSSHL